MRITTQKGKPINKDAGIKALRIIKEVFESMDIKYWLDYGTLLGAVRENGKFIEYDVDIDISIQYSEEKVPEQVCKKLLSRGCTTKFWGKRRHLKVHRNDLPPIGIGLYHSPESTKVFSMFFYYLPITIRKGMIRFVHIFYSQSQNKVIRPESDKERREKLLCKLARYLLPIFFCAKLKKIKFYDIYVNIPEKAEELLILHYGKEWKIPKKVYETYTT